MVGSIDTAGDAARRRPELGTRTPVRGSHAAASTPHPAATRVAIDVLRRGGNAADAAVAAAAVCTVVQPFSSSLAGVGWATVHDAASATTEVLDFHGAVPAALDPSVLGPGADGLVDWQRLEADGRAMLGMLTPCTVPGWAALVAARGRWSLADVLAPAIELARDGVTVSPALAMAVQRSAHRLAPWGAAGALVLPGGRPLQAGERFVQRDLAQTLERIALDGPDEMISGRTADALVRFAAANGGCLGPDDLVAHPPQWAEPLRGRFRDLVICAAPGPYGDVALLEGLHLLDAFPPFSGPLDPDYVHVSVEVAKLVASDRVRHLGPDEPDAAAQLLDPGYLDGLRRRVGATASAASTSARAPEDTITLAVVDGEGNAVHLMQTVGNLFGIGAVADGTGMFLNSSLYFAYTGGSTNRVEPGQPIEQNPCTMMAFDPSGALRLVMGTPGGKTRVETVRQMLVNAVDFGLDLQAAVDEGRFLCAPDGTGVDFEVAAGPLPSSLQADLLGRGHRVQLVDDEFGTGQAVAVDPVSGDRLAAADWRLEASAAAF